MLRSSLIWTPRGLLSKLSCEIFLQLPSSCHSKLSKSPFMPVYPVLSIIVWDFIPQMNSPSSPNKIPTLYHSPIFTKPFLNSVGTPSPSKIASTKLLCRIPPNGFVNTSAAFRIDWQCVKRMALHEIISRILWYAQA
jgi:hypothetical protein